MATGLSNSSVATPQKERSLTWSTWIEVNLDALGHNLQEIEQHSHSPILPILKADAYGHGAPVVAAFLQSLGYHFMAVSTVEEALSILECTKPTLLVLTPPSLEQLPLVLQHGIIPTITSPRLVVELGKLAQQKRQKVVVHLKIDTGLGRLGVAPKDAWEIIRLIKNTPYLSLGGIFTHFSEAFKNSSFTKTQLNRLLEFRTQLSKTDPVQLLWHAANSAAFLSLPASHLDLVRIGTLLYGQTPLPLDPTWHLQETWRVKARLLQIRTLPKGHGVGYGRDYRARKAIRVGVIALGFCHGVELEPQGTPKHQLKVALGRLIHAQHPKVFYQDQSLPLIGRIGMGLSCVDLNSVPELDVGQELTVPMRRVTASAHLPRLYYYQERLHCVFWNNKFYYKGQWRTNSRGLFLTKFPPHRGSSPEPHTLVGQ